jgi:hypothetical protein
LCGQVRYSVDAAPAFQVACHCRNCQKQSGAAFSVNLGVPRAALVVTGAVKTFAHTGDSGRRLVQSFCPQCGSPVFSALELDPGLAILKAGTLDDPSVVRPERHIFWARRQGWEARPEGVPVHDGATP